jgi:transposase
MGYIRMTEEHVFELFRRWHAGQGIKRIANSERRDRKTVRSYLYRLRDQGYTRDKPMPEKEELMQAIAALIPATRRIRTAFEQLEPYEDELRALITDPREPVKAKTAWWILKHKYRLKASYETYKRFVREKDIRRRPKPTTIRIELPPGLQTQIDYGKVGLLYDHESKRKRVVYAFCGVLSHSRLPFIEFVYKQDQVSFCESVVLMLEFYGGCTETLSLDNMKTAVIKPDLWDPKLNKSLQELAEYYGIFIDPNRVARAQDNAKVERFVPVAREVFRMLKHTNPTHSLAELNRLALQWCRLTYGQKEHGTTGVPPMVLFEQVEKHALKALPDRRFEVPQWKKAKVHPDQFFSFDKKRYSLPKHHRGKHVWVRKSGTMIRIFFQHRMIRTYMIPTKSFAYRPEDFPEVLSEMMNGDYPRYLLHNARAYGRNAYLLIESILQPHAYLNARRAQGMLEVMKAYRDCQFFSSICAEAREHGVKLPATFKARLEDAKKQMPLEFFHPQSSRGKAMIRNIGYYLN